MSKGTIEEIIATLQRGAIRTLDGIVKFIETCTTDWHTAIKEYGGWGKLLQDAWNIENKVVDLLTFKEVVAWLKGHLPKDIRCRACMTVLDKELVASLERRRMKLLQERKELLAVSVKEKLDNGNYGVVNCLCDTDKEDIFDMEEAQDVEAEQLDDVTIRNFGDKEMIVLQ